jgi:hypothetical protein
VAQPSQAHHHTIPTDQQETTMTAPVAQRCPTCELFLPTNFIERAAQAGGGVATGVPGIGEVPAYPCPNCEQLLMQGPNGEIMAISG